MFKGKSFITTSLVFILTFILFGTLSNLISFQINYWIQTTLTIFISFLITYLIIGNKKNRDQIKSNHFDNKKIRLINYIVIVLAIFVITLTPFFQSTWFYVRHIVIFILIAFQLCFNGYFIGKKLMTKHINKTNILKIITLGSVFIGLMLFGNLQIYYIQNYEIPPLYGCSYYDELGNLIYNSQIAGSCPELEEVVNHQYEESRVLSFSVHEEIFRIYEDDLLENQLVNEKYFYDSQIEYQYDLINRVTHYNMNLVISGYVYDKELNDYRIYRKTVINKSIENIYEENRLTSNHQLNKTVTDDDHIIEMLSYDYDIQYVSELKTNDDEYIIEVTKTINNDTEELTELLYNIDIVTYDNEYIYLVHKQDKEEYLVLSVDNRNPEYNDFVIKKDYRSSVYDRMRTEKELYFNYYGLLSNSDQLIYKNEFSRSNPYFGTNLDYTDNHILRTYEDGLFKQGFYNFTNVVEQTNYGFRINHYHTQRENDLSYNTYHQTMKYNIDYPNNGLSVELEYLNNYERSLYYPDFYRMELIYQDNPLLLRSYVEELIE